MDSPTDMVKQALLSGHRDDNRGGIGYIRTCFGYSIRLNVYARLRTNILKVNPDFGIPKDKELPPEEPKLKDEEFCVKYLDTMDPELNLALTINTLLKDHSATTILKMVTIVACVQKKD